MRPLILLAALALAACTQGAPEPQAEGPRQVAPILTGDGGARHAQLRPAGSGAGDPCRARPRRRFRRRGGWPARRRSTSRRRRAREEIVLDQQGAGDRGGHRRAPARRCATRSAPGDEARGQPLTVRIGAARRIRIRYRCGARRGGAAMADPGRRPRASATPICSARARRSSTGPGSRPRTAPASARPGRRGSPRPSR